MGKTSLVLNIAQHVGTKTGHDGRLLLARDVEGAAVHAPADVGGAHRRAPPARRVSRRARLGPALHRHRHAERSEDLHRRHAVDRRARDAREMPAAQVRARPAPGHHRLHPADAGPRPVREPDAGSRVDFAIAQGPREGTERARSSCCRSSAARRNRAPTIGRSSPTFENPAPSSRTRTSSRSSIATMCIRTRASRRPTRRAWRSSSSASSATGPTGVVKLAFIREYTRFENLALGSMADIAESQNRRMQKAKPILPSCHPAICKS